MNQKRGQSLSTCVDDIKQAGQTVNIEPTWKILMEDLDLGELTSFLDHENLGYTQKECIRINEIVTNYREMLEYRISAGGKEKLFTRGQGKLDTETTSC